MSLPHRIWPALAAISLLIPAPLRAEPKKTATITEAHYRIYQGNGEPATLDQMMQALGRADVVFLGEEHNDPVAHHLELLIFKRLHEQQGMRPPVLSLEMFERDVQHVVDEYLAGLITETHFLGSARPWKNYKDDYRPLVEHAKTNKLGVIAANAPRRYVNLAGREGAAALRKVPEPRRRGLPPLPYAKASPAYEAKFKAIMEKMKSKTPKKDDKKPAEPKKTDTKPDKAPPKKHDLGKALEAQSLWDASMAYSIAEHLMRSPTSRVLQLNGSFHTGKRLGIPEHLLRYRPGTTLSVVTIVPDKAFPKFNVKEMTALGDFVIVTDASLPRTYDTSPPKKKDAEPKRSR